MSYIQVDNLVKEYGNGKAAFLAVKGMSFEIEQGEFISVVGESGSGKSTLLSMMGALNTPTSGGYIVDDIDFIHSGRTKGRNLGGSFWVLFFRAFT